MNATKKSCAHQEIPVSFSRARIPGMMSEVWPSILATGLLTVSGGAHAGNPTFTPSINPGDAEAAGVWPGSSFTVQSINDYNGGDCEPKARVSNNSGSCTPDNASGGDSGWQFWRVGSVGPCSGAGTATKTYTMAAAPTAACQIKAEGWDSNAANGSYQTRIYTVKARQSIIVDIEPPLVAEGNDVFQVGAHATSGLGVTTSLVGDCTYAAPNVTMTAPTGNCAVTFSQAGNAVWMAATSVTYNVNKGQQKILVTQHAPATKPNGGTFTVAAKAVRVVGGADTQLNVTVTGSGSCTGTGTSNNGTPVTITMTAATGICSVFYTGVAGVSPVDGVSYDLPGPVTEYVWSASSSGCVGEGTYTELKFQNTGGYIGWACNNGDFVAPGHSISCWPPLYLPLIHGGWSIQPGIGFKGHVLQTALNPGKTFRVQVAPGGGGYYNILNTTDATCLASGNGVYEAWGTRKGSNSSAGYLVAIQDSATMPSGKYCDYSASQTRWKLNISGTYTTFETAGYPSWPSPGCIGSDSAIALSRVLLDWGNGNYGNWGDSWVRNAAPSCGSNGAKISCGGYSFPSPNHLRFEFDPTTAMVCQPPAITMRLCNNAMGAIGSPAPCVPFNATVAVRPRSLSGIGTWNGLGPSSPWATFTSVSSGITLSAPKDTVVSLGFDRMSVPLTDSTLECYDTKNNMRISCINVMTYKDCPDFDAVEKGALTGTNLYTKLAGTAFDFDVIGMPTYLGNATVDLVDVSAGPSCTAPPAPVAVAGKQLAASFTAPSASVGSIIYNFIAANAGKKTFTVNYADVARKAAIRIIDKTGKCYESSDTFSIRPKEFALAVSYPGGTPPKAGVAFTLTATAKNTAGATTAAYLGTPAINFSNIYDWKNDPVVGILSGSFNPAVGGVATGAAFKFSGVGALNFLKFDADNSAYAGWKNGYSSSVRDTTDDDPANNGFVKVSRDYEKGDCIKDSYSIVPSGGKYGCNIGSTGPLTTDKFVPDHYQVKYDINPPDCIPGTSQTYTYLGQDFAPSETSPTPIDSLQPNQRIVKIIAQDADDKQLSNLTTAYAAADKPTFKVEAVNAAAVIANPASAAPVNMDLNTTYDWNGDGGGGGVYVNTFDSDTNAHPGRVPRPATPVNYESFALKTTLLNNLGGATIKDAAHCVNGTLSGANLVCTSNPVHLRFGMLKMESDYETDQKPLRVLVRAWYWDGATSSWLVNTDDSCTTLVTNTADANRNLARGNYNRGLTAANVTNTAPSSLRLAAGQTRIQFDPTLGVTGWADVALNLGTTTSDNSVCPATALEAAGTVGANLTWLRGNWCGAGYTSDPGTRITVGIPKSQFLYLREKY